MLSFDSGLSDSLKLGNTTAFWVLKLYYNNGNSLAYQADGSTLNQTNGAINSTTTTIDVDYGAGFVANDIILIDSEVIKVVSISTNELTVIRGHYGSTPASHNDNSNITFNNFIGVSDVHRKDGIDTYYGLVKSWGSLNQSADIFNFTVSTSSISVNLINTENSIQGQRLSDIFSSNNFENRKWELFLNTNSVSTFDTADRMIATGIISGDLKYDYNSVQIVLLDGSNSFHDQIPKNKVESSSYVNAPEINIGKPIPIFYGDCSAYSTSGSSGLEGDGSAGNIDHYFTRSKVPAIVTDIWNSSSASGIAKPDSVVLNELSTDNIYMYRNNHYYQFNSNVTKSESSHQVGFSGNSFSVFLPLVPHSTSVVTGSITRNEFDTADHGLDWSNTVDGDVTTHGQMSAFSATNYDATVQWRFPEYKEADFGDFIASNPVKLIIFYKDFHPNSASNVDSFQFNNLSGISGDLTFYNGSSDEYAEIHNISSDFVGSGGIMQVQLQANTSNHAVKIRAIGVEVSFTLLDDKNFTKTVTTDLYEIPNTRSRNPEFPYELEERIGTETFNKSIKVGETKSIINASVGDYLYVSGKGREYGAWIDTISGSARTNANGSASEPSENSGDLITNSKYVIEDILRTELGVDSSTTGENIDLESFDSASSGISVNLAFSQYKFINSYDLIAKICKQIMAFVWYSGNGKFKIKYLPLPAGTFSANKTINFNDIVFKTINKTPLNNVRNNIIINYAYDYARDKYLKTSTASDSTSSGSSSSGYNQSLTLEFDANCIANEHLASKATQSADALSDAYLKHLKDRKIVLNFEIPTPKYNDLEVTDFVQFSNWDTNLKLYGTAYSNDYFMITKISKRVNGCSITAIKVDS